MQVARRIYLYLVSFISLQIVIMGAMSLGQLLITQGLSGQPGNLGNGDVLRMEFSSGTAALVVGTLAWAIHWGLAQRAVHPDRPGAVDERRSVLRALMLHGVLLVSTWNIFLALAQLVQSMLSALVDAGNGRAAMENSLRTLPVLIIYGCAAAYYWRVRATDTALVGERERVATIRRWYTYLALAGSLAVLVFASADLLRYLWDIVTSYNPPLSGTLISADSLTWIMARIGTGLAIWLFFWLPTQQQVAGSPAEQRALLRKVYGYGLTALAVGMTLVSLGLVLNDGLRLLLGSDPLAASGKTPLTAAGEGLATALAFGTLWAYQRWVLHTDATWLAAEPPRAATVRRLYHYLISAISLSALAGGVADLLYLLITFWLDRAAPTLVSLTTRSETISRDLTLVIVGLCVWVYQWRLLQRQATAPDAPAERQALPRRVYLYLALFASVLTVIGSVGWTLYQVLLTVGTPAQANLLHDLSRPLSAGLVAAVVLIYHLLVMRGDLQARPVVAVAAPEAALPSPAGAVPVLLFVASAAPPATIGALVRNALPAGSHVVAFPAPGLEPPAVDAWLRSQEPPPAPPVETPRGPRLTAGAQPVGAVS